MEIIFKSTDGDSLTAQEVSYPPNGYGFTTWDRDNDGSSNINCGEIEHAGDSLTAPDVTYPPNGYGFSTWDRDNDGSSHKNCGEIEHAGWWFNLCTEGNLNGKYYNGGMIENDGIYWEAWKLS
ncbi:fibrinogen-like protein 1 [Mytilus trossulus]|uniref:fibrinogen-like protein 1 n=1 Tax=Mytilus trossulus TaxID=6551 RepID=UPI0030078084